MRPDSEFTDISRQHHACSVDKRMLTPVLLKEYQWIE